MSLFTEPTTNRYYNSFPGSAIQTSSKITVTLLLIQYNLIQIFQFIINSNFFWIINSTGILKWTNCGL